MNLLENSIAFETLFFVLVMENILGVKANVTKERGDGLIAKEGYFVTIITQVQKRMQTV